jgi:hypothetical protein
VASSQAATASAGATEATESTMPGSTRRERAGSPPGAAEASATGATGVMSTPTGPQTRAAAWDRSHGDAGARV